MLKATVKNETFFFADESLQFIPVETSDKIKVPKVMPNTEFTNFFSSTISTVGDFTNVVVVGNFMLNLLLSGTMTFIWGLLNSLQVVSHFPLINIMMPANAQYTFQTIVLIATFELIPTGDLIDGMEDGLGIRNLEYSLTDNFIDFGFDTTDPIRNLSVLFIFMMFLVAYPVLSLFLRGLCFWCDKCNQCLAKIDQSIFFNTYLRYGLESYLELCISSLLRFH